MKTQFGSGEITDQEYQAERMRLLGKEAPAGGIPASDESKEGAKVKSVESITVFFGCFVKAMDTHLPAACFQDHPATAMCPRTCAIAKVAALRRRKSSRLHCV